MADLRSWTKAIPNPSPRQYWLDPLASGASQNLLSPLSTHCERGALATALVMAFAGILLY
ncbi:MAG: hypothetical protein WBQ10_15970 [Terriglobales bacterium]